PSRGLVRIDELVSTEAEVVGADGAFHPVGPAFPTGVKPVYRLRTKAGYELRLTADHRVLTANRGDVPACELTRDDAVVLGQGIYARSRPGSELHGSVTLDERLRDFLGLLVGDGCLMGEPEAALLTL